MGDIQHVINKAKEEKNWQEYGYYFLCDAPAIDISVGNKDLSITSICGPRPEDGTALPEPSQEVVALKDTLSQISYMTVDSYDAVTEVEPQPAVDLSKLVTYKVWIENVWNPTAPHIETRDLVKTDWGYEGSSTKLRAFEKFYKALPNKLAAYGNWLENVWIPTGPHIETFDYRVTDWGYRGSSSRLNAFESFYSKFADK
ncbi:hypothetical protein [Spartinivicinus poritis]|uniref:Uncharacterized protein n=1 Tax=Spartinivicinus poritis TaxID=2994640 RepID=A0ABT5UHH4_9GAMM|nr:hypothetical protein [Spartinivicinus sp. A2-2]MDE1465660.1 hypothetical protein [Spartinivicinus sp. A2-2]